MKEKLAAAALNSGFTSLDAKLASAGKEVLASIVKVAQKQEMRGEKGGWKEFLNSYERFGASTSDPSRRTPDVLLAFLRTFKEDSDWKFFDKMMQCHSNRKTTTQYLKSIDAESPPEQRLVRMTLEHPQYPIDFSFPSYEEDWIVTKLSAKRKRKRSVSMIAVDCEMVLCEDDTEALVKICVVDRDLQVKLDEFVKPNKAVADYRTSITGVSEKDLDGANCSLVDIQKSMKKLLSHGTILVGHSLSNDLKALKIDHATVVDTSYIFKYGGESVRRRPSLINLSKSVLGYDLRKKGDPHNCYEDACAAMKLVLAKIEKGFDGDLPPIKEEAVPKQEMTMLFFHRVPKMLSSDELHKVIPGDYTLEIQKKKNGRGEKYSALAIFKDSQQALQAYENVNAREVEDSYGRPQKCLTVQLSSGVKETIYVSKTLRGKPGHEDKMPVDEATSEEEKSKKKDHSCPDHEEEIERLKNLLSQRDREISSLQKILAALTRKHGL
ncbi:hypothetical protein Dimus_014267 [Dionaea muscipula]